MRDMVRPHLDGVLHRNADGTGDALKVAGLLGHYLGEGGRHSDLRHG
jgi:hypothetical protein